MAAAIPAAIGVGSSLIGGIQGKGARKKQEKLAAQQLAQLQPIIQAFQRMGLQGEALFPEAANMFRESYGRAGELGDVALTDYKRLLDNALGKSDELFTAGRSLMGRGEGLLGRGEELIGKGGETFAGGLNYLRGAATGLGDLQKFYRPFMEGGSAIDKFLPSKARTESLLAPEFGQVNEGYEATLRGLENAPRGGGRIGAFNQANVARQKGLSDVFFQGRQALGEKSLGAAFGAAGGEASRLGQLAQLGIGQGQLGLGQGQLGIGQGQLGLGAMGQGLGTITAGTQYLGTGGGLAQNAMNQSLQALTQRLQAGGGIGSLSQSGLSNASSLFNLYNAQANRAYGATPPTGTTGKGLGGFLVDFFNNKGVQDKVGGIFKGLFGGGGGMPEWWGGD